MVRVSIGLGSELGLGLGLGYGCNYVWGYGYEDACQRDLERRTGRCGEGRYAVIPATLHDGGNRGKKKKKKRQLKKKVRCLFYTDLKLSKHTFRLLVTNNGVRQGNISHMFMFVRKPIEKHV